MKYILNVINILVYINSASNNTSSASVMLSCVLINECTITQLNITLAELVLFDAELA